MLPGRNQQRYLRKNQSLLLRAGLGDIKIDQLRLFQPQDISMSALGENGKVQASNVFRFGPTNRRNAEKVKESKVHQGERSRVWRFQLPCPSGHRRFTQ
jgi:hypothetical protein